MDAEVRTQAVDAEAALFAGLGIGGVTDAARLVALDEILVDDDNIRPEARPHGFAPGA